MCRNRMTVSGKKYKKRAGSIKNERTCSLFLYGVVALRKKRYIVYFSKRVTIFCFGFLPCDNSIETRPGCARIGLEMLNAPD